jgi:hypothetical protein
VGASAQRVGTKRRRIAWIPPSIAHRLNARIISLPYPGLASRIGAETVDGPMQRKRVTYSDATRHRIGKLTAQHRR